MSEKEAFRLLLREPRRVTPPASGSYVSSISGWHVWDVRPRGYVAVVWEVQVRSDLPPVGSTSSLDVAYQWSREKAKALLRQLPLTPPNDVAAALVQRLRPEASQQHIALKPMATLWFEASLTKPQILVRDLPETQRQEEQIWRSGRTSISFEWFTDDAVGRGILLNLRSVKHPDGTVRARVRWTGWTDPSLKDVPPQTEWVHNDMRLGPMLLLFYDAEYEVSPEPPDGLKTIPPFHLRITTPRPRVVGEPPPSQIFLWSSDSRARLATYERRGTVRIPVEPEGIWRLRVVPDTLPQNGQLTITLEGNGNHWEKQIHVGNSQWVWIRRPGIYETFFSFDRLKPGQYTLRVEGEIVWRVDGTDVVKRKVQWSKTIEAKSSWQETVIVPLPR